MYCTNCGNERPADALVCAQCGHVVEQFAAPGRVPNYLVQSILVTLCCCLPFGVVALVFSAQVNAKLAAGDVAGAQLSSNRAKNWLLAAFVTGILTFAGLSAVTLMQR